MARIWQHRCDGSHYEIRTAGRSVRLYTNGVLHSQYHPEHVFGGGVWDLLGLPALWSPGPHLSGVLMLGLGGGAAVRQLHELRSWDRFVALERNPVHIRVARRFFDLDALPAELLELDAVPWTSRYAGDPFDLVIDDLFSDARGEASRAVRFTPGWYRRLRRLVSSRGILVVNFGDTRELSRALRSIPGLSKDFASVYKLTLPAYGNAVAALLREPHTAEELDRAVKAIRPRRRRSRLRYHLEPVRL